MVVSEHDTFVCMFYMLYLSTAPIPEKSRICDLLILFNFYLIDESTKKRFPKFSLTNVNLFCKHEQILFLTAATHSKKVGTEAK